MSFYNIHVRLGVPMTQLIKMYDDASPESWVHGAVENTFYVHSFKLL